MTLAKFDRFLDQLTFQLKVLVALFVKLFKERILVVEKCFEGRPEFLVHFFRFRARQSANNLPTFLDVENIFCFLIPLFYPIGLEGGELLNIITKFCLLIQVDVKFLLKVFQILMQ